MAEKTIALNHITKIEGHANLNLKVRGNEVVKCELSSIEGSRYFEGMLKGRMYNEAPEMTSRICGICSNAHHVCSSMAMENALGIEKTHQTHVLRNLQTMGERIRSHVTHLYFLALPDYLGYESAIPMAAKYKDEISRALRLMKLGNSLLSTVVGRDIHPISNTIGGYTALPDEKRVNDFAVEIEKCRKDAVETAKLFAKLKYPKFERETLYFSLYNNMTYPTLFGYLRSKEKTFQQMEYKTYLNEYHEKDSTSNFVVKKGKAYMVGALARMNNNFDFLSDNAKKIAKQSGIEFPNYNPFMNNFCQAVELVHYIDRAIFYCKEYKIEDKPVLDFDVKAGHGITAIEVPRGILIHEYDIDKNGIIKNANIITPTCQNLRNMEEDIRAFIPSVLHLPKEKMVLEIEKLIRSYDPCFSCSTHFLDVKWE